MATIASDVFERLHEIIGLILLGVVPKSVVQPSPIFSTEVGSEDALEIRV